MEVFLTTKADQILKDHYCIPDDCLPLSTHDLLQVCPSENSSKAFHYLTHYRSYSCHSFASLSGVAFREFVRY